MPGTEAQNSSSWAAIISATVAVFALLGGFWAAGISPVKETLTQQREEILHLQNALHAADIQRATLLQEQALLLIPRREHEEYQKRMQDAVEALREQIRAAAAAAARDCRSPSH